MSGWYDCVKKYERADGDFRDLVVHCLPGTVCAKKRHPMFFLVSNSIAMSRGNATGNVARGTDFFSYKYRDIHSRAEMRNTRMFLLI